MATIPSQIFISNPSGKLVVSINVETGVVTFGEGYKPTEAAAEFWRAVQAMGGCSQKPAAPKAIVTPADKEWDCHRDGSCTPTKGK